MGLPVCLAAVPALSADDDAAILDIADDPPIAHAALPVIFRLRARERLADRARIVQRRKPAFSENRPGSLQASSRWNGFCRSSLGCDHRGNRSLGCSYEKRSPASRVKRLRAAI